MHELFDLISGSETGALLAGTLVLPANKTQLEKNPNQKNALFANASMEYFKENAQYLYKSQTLEWYWSALIVAIFVIIFSLLTFYFLSKYLNPKKGYEKSCNHLLSHLKQELQEVEPDLQDNNLPMSPETSRKQLTKMMRHEKNIVLRQVMYKINLSHSSKDKDRVIRE